jgi:hypothetical protein
MSRGLTPHTSTLWELVSREANDKGYLGISLKRIAIDCETSEPVELITELQSKDIVEVCAHVPSKDGDVVMLRLLVRARIARIRR